MCDFKDSVSVSVSLSLSARRLAVKMYGTYSITLVNKNTVRSFVLSLSLSSAETSLCILFCGIIRGNSETSVVCG